MKVLNMGLQCPFSESPSTNRMAARRLSIVYGSFVVSKAAEYHRRISEHLSHAARIHEKAAEDNDIGSWARVSAE
jgi:hypothetical protein